MSSLSDYARALLQGGLPAALDVGTSGGAKTGDSKPETVKPAGTLADRDTSAPANSITSFVTPKEIMIGVAGLIVVGAILYISIRAANRI